MMERLWKDWGEGFAMIRDSERVVSSRGRLESLKELSSMMSSSSTGAILNASESKEWSGVPKYPLSRKDFRFRLAFISCDGGGVSIEGARIGDSCKRGGAAVMEGDGSSSKSGNFEVEEVFRDRRPWSSLLDTESARGRPTFSCWGICIASSTVGIE